MINTKDIEYVSNCLLMINDWHYDKFYVIKLDSKRYGELGLVKTQMVVFDTYTDGLTNSDVEDAIRQVLNDNYDIDYEIEKYRESRLYENLRGNEE